MGAINYLTFNSHSHLLEVHVYYFLVVTAGCLHITVIMRAKRINGDDCCLSKTVRKNKKVEKKLNKNATFNMFLFNRDI